MNLVEWLQRIMVGFGAAWVMWLMLGLSVVSVAIILERAWFFWSLRDDVPALARDLQTTLDQSLDAAKKRMEASPSAEAAVVLAGLAVAHKGADAAEEAMAGAAALQRMKLERRLAYLGTLGNNAPFIGLFGTVIGVVGAFDALGKTAKQPMAQAAAQAMAPQTVMSSIAEALVATAVGLMVAIPAVAANNFYQRHIKWTLANTEALTRVLLSYLKAEPEGLGEAASTSHEVADAIVHAQERKSHHGEPARPGKAKAKAEPAPASKRAAEKKAADVETTDEEAS
jgi:biopolymer transport protein ExbB